MKRQIEIAKKLLESKGYSLIKESRVKLLGKASLLKKGYSKEDAMSHYKDIDYISGMYKVAAELLHTSEDTILLAHLSDFDLYHIVDSCEERSHIVEIRSVASEPNVIGISYVNGVVLIYTKTFRSEVEAVAISTKVNKLSNTNVYDPKGFDIDHAVDKFSELEERFSTLESTSSHSTPDILKAILELRKLKHEMDILMSYAPPGRNPVVGDRYRNLTFAIYDLNIELSNRLK